MQFNLDALNGPLELSQNRRLVHLETALASATLVVQSAEWVECVNGFGDELAFVHSTYFGEHSQSLLPVSTGAGVAPPLCPFLAVVDSVSGSGNLALKSLMGEQVRLGLTLPGGSHRVFSGYVVMAANLGSGNGRPLIRMGVASFTHFLHQRQDTRVFVQKTPDLIIGSVLSAYPQANFRMALSAEALTRRGVTTQYNETDAAFVARLLSEEGWNWYLEHEQDGVPLKEAKAAQHCLVITDARQSDAHQGALRFSKPDVRQGGGLVEDTITQLSVVDQVRANAVALGSWDPSQLAGVSASAQAAGPEGLPRLEIYRGRSERLFAEHGQGSAQDRPSLALAEHRAQLLLEQQRLDATLLHGRGAVRSLKVFESFDIQEHSRWSGDEARHRALSIHHKAVNNLGLDVAALMERPEVGQGGYQQLFTAVPATTSVVPPEVRAPYGKPRVEAQVAVVMGWDEDAFGPITTNRDLQVRIQFPWQRGEHPVLGGLAGPETPHGEATGHAPGSAASSVWVRVSQSMAGANWGATFLPRVGTEVLVEFIDGDPDRPLVIGQLHNPQDASPWPAGEGAQANHEGVLSGIQTHSHAGAQDGINQWLLDDTPGQLRMRLASWGQGSPWSELTLGHLIGQGRLGSDTHRGPWLGSGYYAHTDGWAVLRAQEGLLLSTTTRAASYGSAQGTQMASPESIQKLKVAQQLGRRLNGALEGQGAATLSSHEAQQALERFIQDLDPKYEGKYSEPVGGQEISQAKPQSRELDESRPVERFNRPHIVMETPSAAVLTSPGPISSFSGQDTSLTAQGDLHLASAHSIAAVSGQTTSLYTHQGPMNLIAANADLSLQAHTDTLELLSDGLIEVQSVNGEIHISAQNKIELISGDSRVVLEGNNIDYRCQQFIVQAGVHEFAGPAAGERSPAPLNSLPDFHDSMLTPRMMKEN